VGDLAVLSEVAGRIGSPIRFTGIEKPADASGILESGSVPVRDCGIISDTAAFKPGEVSSAGGNAAVGYIREAVRLALEEELCGIVTGPINKESIREAGFTYKGHTEMLQELTGSSAAVTMFSVDRLKILFHTRHVSIREAIEGLDAAGLAASIKLGEQCLQSIGMQKPHLALAALNPHASDGGLFGREEEEILIPAIEQAREAGVLVSGPAPADSVFHQCLEGTYDAVISLYHDQGNIAAKTYDFLRTVSITFGYPFLRTSVDHGTAFDIAWQGKASGISMESAVAACGDLAGAYNPSVLKRYG
jgi:4-hydroxythreonine-4-phosphate dehydrogenase